MPFTGISHRLISLICENERFVLQKNSATQKQFSFIKEKPLVSFIKTLKL